MPGTRGVLFAGPAIGGSVYSWGEATPRATEGQKAIAMTMLNSSRGAAFFAFANSMSQLKL